MLNSLVSSFVSLKSSLNKVEADLDQQRTKNNVSAVELLFLKDLLIY